MSLWIKFGALAVLVALVAFGAVKIVSTYNGAITAAETAKKGLSDEQAAHAVTRAAFDLQATEVKQAKERAEKLDQLAQEKAREAEKSQAVAKQFRTQFEALKRDKPEIKAWAAQPIPPDVRNLLRAGTEKAGAPVDH